MTARRGTLSTWHGSLIEDKKDPVGTHYRHNRYCDAKSGRFTQDPMGLAGALNAYGFGNGNPVAFSDPFGLSCEPKPECEEGKGRGGLLAAAATIAVAEPPPAGEALLLAAAAAAATVVVADALADAASAAQDKLNDYKFVTYTRTNAATGQVYSGRTSGFGSATQLASSRAATHPPRLAGFGPPVVDRVAPGTAQGYAAIRGREQHLIDAHGEHSVMAVPPPISSEAWGR